MRKTSARPSTLFLMELIISILFFSLAAAVCVQFLAKSHTVSHESALLRDAEEHCTSVAEMITVSDSIEEFYTHITTLIKAKTQDEEGHLRCSISDTDNISTSEAATSGYIDVFFDINWFECHPEEAAFVLHTTLTSDGRMLTGDVSLIEYADYVTLADNVSTEPVPSADSGLTESVPSAHSVSTEPVPSASDNSADEKLAEVSVYSLHVVTHIQKEVKP